MTPAHIHLSDAGPGVRLRPNNPVTHPAFGDGLACPEFGTRTILAWEEGALEQQARLRSDEVDRSGDR